MEASGLKLGRFISERRLDTFAWGINDCNTFTAQWVDRCKNTDITSDIQYKYSTVKEMLRFSKVKKMKHELSKAGYAVVSGTPTTGDILIRKDDKGFYHSAIVMHGYAYTMDVEKDLVKADVGKIMQASPETEIWRTANA